MEDLKEAKDIYIRQSTRFFRNNKYNVETSVGKHILTIQENTNFLWHLSLCSSRPFEMYIKDLNGEIMFAVFRPLKCRNLFCLPCWSKHEVWITDGTGKDLGTIAQEYSYPRPHFVVKNDKDVVRLTIEAPICPYTAYCCRREAHFKVIFQGTDLKFMFKERLMNFQD